MPTSHQVKVNGHHIHYVVQGKGKPVVFIHGIPTSSYLWRNVMSRVASHHRCIAPDLIGMGKSDKPDIDYSIRDHIDYFTKFIDALGLTSFDLVMHGWGSIIGFAYAKQYPDKINSMAFVEAYINLPDTRRDAPLPVQEIAHLAHDPEKLKHLIFEENYLVEKLLSHIMLKKLSPEELEHYRSPFKIKKHRKVLYQFALEQPYHNTKSPAAKLVKEYSEWLKKAPQRKLMMYGMPGFLTNMSTVAWAIDHLPNLTVVEVGHGLHYLPETRAIEIGETLAGWL
jgi:haloalkane dehalogenase